SRTGTWISGARGRQEPLPAWYKATRSMIVSRTQGRALSIGRSRADAADPTLPAILEFRWPSTAIANAPIPRSARGVTWVITSLVAASIAAMGLIPIDQVVTARGIAVPTS